LSRTGRTATARAEQPALRHLPCFEWKRLSMSPISQPLTTIYASRGRRPFCRTAVCGPACTVVWGAPSAMAAPTRFVYARHGGDCCGVQVPCTKLGVSRRSIYQMNTPIDKVLDEGNCGRATDRGEEACECVRKYRPVFTAGRILVKAARLRTETSYKAGSARQVSTTSRGRCQKTDVLP